MSWFEIVKETVEYEDDFCCKDIVNDMEKYFIPFWDNLPISFPYRIGSKTCGELIQDLEDIENDGILVWMNKYQYPGVWGRFFNTGVLSDMQEIVNMILKAYRDCSEYHSVNSNMGDLR